MSEFLAVHKIGLLVGGLIAAAAFLYLRRGKGTDIPAGVPVDPYSSTPPAQNNVGGGFDIGNLLPAGPAGPVLDPTASSQPENTAAPVPDAVQNSGPITPSSTGVLIAAGQITPSGQIDTGVGGTSAVLLGEDAGQGGPLRGDYGATGGVFTTTGASTSSSTGPGPAPAAAIPIPAPPDSGYAGGDLPYGAPPPRGMQ